MNRLSFLLWSPILLLHLHCKGKKNDSEAQLPQATSLSGSALSLAEAAGVKKIDMSKIHLQAPTVQVNDYKGAHTVSLTMPPLQTGLALAEEGNSAPLESIFYQYSVTSVANPQESQTGAAGLGGAEIPYNLNTTSPDQLNIEVSACIAPDLAQGAACSAPFLPLFLSPSKPPPTPS
jgi:hypothetical protein